MMQQKQYFSVVFLFVSALIFLSPVVTPVAVADPIIADHHATDITAIPQSAIERAKSTLHIAYGHTSHGSQLTTGMRSLVAFANGGGKGLVLPRDIFDFGPGGEDGALDLRDSPFSNARDLGNPNRTAWAGSTRNYLNAHPEVNVIIWSWCSQVSNATEANINTYLNLMSSLENDYPNVRFVYMTGHLDGGGLSGNLHQRNEQIRNYCINNDKILFDFADIESYDPDGRVNYNELLATDTCAYDSDNDGSTDRNWAQDWQDTHTEGVDWYRCGSAHSQPLNANQKAYAAWWLWARLAGWGDCTQRPGDLNATADSSAANITLNWVDNSTDESNFIIHRRVDQGTWDTAYATVAAGTSTFIDEGLAPGAYEYRVVAHRNNDGTGNPCDSGHSNTARAQIINPNQPAAPSNLTATADAQSGTIALAWRDNADNESEFVIQRQVDDEQWNNSYATVGENQTTFQDTELTEGTYRYRVIATNSHADSGPSNTAEANIAQSVPNAPSNLTCTANGFDIALSWRDNSDNEDGFSVERSVDGADFSLLSEHLASNTRSYTDTNLQPGHTYAYRVRAENSFGSSPYSNEVEQYLHEETVTIRLNNDDTGEIVDAFLRSTSPDTNYGDTSYLTQYDRYLLRFNLPAELRGKHIISAEVSFFVYSIEPNAAGTQLDLLQVTQPWEEGEVTWNRATADTPWETAGGTTGVSAGSITVENLDHQFLNPVDIRDTVQQWTDGRTPNYGLILDKGPDVRMGIKASEYSQSSSPYLLITYTNKNCSDFDSDGDTDGADLKQLSDALDPSCLSAFAQTFGRQPE